MTNPNNARGPYVNFTTYHGGENNPEANVKDAAGQIKSAFFLGYVFTGIPGGRDGNLRFIVIVKSCVNK